MPDAIDYRQVADTEQAAQAALDIVLTAAAAAISARGRFVLALSGGRTPGQLYRLLADTDQDWERWHLVYGDERCLPLGHVERTATMVSQHWLDPVGFPKENHHVPAVELGAVVAAEKYSETLLPLLPLDLALLGMGEDGHTASLFPGHSHPDLAVVPVFDAPKPPPERISLGYETLRSARSTCVLVTGNGKQQALRQWLAGQGELPVARALAPGRTILVTDLPEPAD
ncbi:MAG: 6-phosphogluconolactonase [Halioglobus sp.]